MRTRLIIVGLAIAAGAGGIAVWHAQHATAATEPTQAAPQPVPVVAVKVKVSDVPIVLTGIGTVTPYNVVQVHAQVTGTIDTIGFTEGQTVHPGSLIAQLDPRPFQASLQQAEAALARDSANLSATQDDLGRYTTLLKQGFATPQQVTDQSATVNELQAAIAGDKAAIFNAETQLSYTTINAPISGVTGFKDVDVGNIVQPTSTTPIVTITQIQPISVVFTL
ncbi:MAG TPA: efflux RND transporter periplasmic adaptor subunit, partial [Acetobacteraceae bacterium]|nr:efflux RND transporter periplasmic adaptor subunit [Acetobacteraceae bacterium]